MPVALVTLCGTLAIGVLPAVMALAGMPAEVFGFWAGASVHDVGQVVATAQTAGTAALTIAVVVKLARVVMLAPLAAAVAVHRRRTAKSPRAGGAGPAGKQPPVVPLFILGFLALVLLRSTGWLPQPVLDGTALVQEIMLAAALFGLGVRRPAPGTAPFLAAGDLHRPALLAADRRAGPRRSLAGHGRRLTRSASPTIRPRCVKWAG